MTSGRLRIVSSLKSLIDFMSNGSMSNERNILVYNLTWLIQQPLLIIV